MTSQESKNKTDNNFQVSRIKNLKNNILTNAYHKCYNSIIYTTSLSPKFDIIYGISFFCILHYTIFYNKANHTKYHNTTFNIKKF